MTSAALGKDQTIDVFGLDLFERGIQPVWLEVSNHTDNFLHYAPTGSDRNYFSPLEVAYMFRKGYSKDGLDRMERHLFYSGMPRTIPAGTTKSGFVFTNLSQGTKSLFVDLYSTSGNDDSFAFFLDVPGFVPDHADVNFEALYSPSEVQEFDDESFRRMMETFTCCTRNQADDKQGLPVSVVIVGEGKKVLWTLLRSGWYETARKTGNETGNVASGYYLFGRPRDTVFRIQRKNGGVRNELSLWVSPWKLNGTPVWMGVINHFIGRASTLEQVISGDRLDPEIDDGRNFLLQNIWYSQGLAQLAWLNGNMKDGTTQSQTDFKGVNYFTDGMKVVLWVSAKPVALTDVNNRNWDSAPEIKATR